MDTQIFSPDQLFVIGLVASAIVFIVNEIADMRGIQIGRAWLTVVLYVVAFGLAVLFTPQVFPSLPALDGAPDVISAGLLHYLSALLTQLTMLVGAATAIYNILGKRVLDVVATRLLGK